MIPTLAPGERLLVKYNGPIDLGDVVVFKRADQFDVKRIQRIQTDGIFVVGDNDLASTDSRSYGLIPHEDVMGTVIMRIWPKPGRLISNQRTVEIKLGLKYWQKSAMQEAIQLPDSAQYKFSRHKQSPVT